MEMITKKFKMESWNHLLSQKGEGNEQKKGWPKCQEPGGPGELFRKEAVGNVVSRQVGICAFIQMQAHPVCNPCRLLWRSIVMKYICIYICDLIAHLSSINFVDDSTMLQNQNVGYM